MTTVKLTKAMIKDQKIRPVDVIRDLPSGHLKKGHEGVLALHKMRVFVPNESKPHEYVSLEMDGQLFDRYFKNPEPIVMI